MNSEARALRHPGVLRHRVFVAVLVGVLTVLFVASVSAATPYTSATTDTSPACNTSNYCYNSIGALGGAYFTNITAILNFNSYAGVNNSVKAGCYCAYGFSVQLNTNVYSEGAWEQIVEFVETANSNATYPGDSTGGLGSLMLWLNATQPTSPCPAAGGWTLVNDQWQCAYPEAHRPWTIPIGQDYQIMGSLVFSSTFEANGTVLERQSFIEDGKTVATSRGYDWLPVNPYGQITSIGATIVGLGDYDHATFGPGTNLTLVLLPETNLGGKLGLDWGPGGNPGLTGETSNLNIANVWYTDSEQGQEFVGAPITATTSETTSTPTVTTSSQHTTIIPTSTSTTSTSTSLATVSIVSTILTSTASSIQVTSSNSGITPVSQSSASASSHTLSTSASVTSTNTLNGGSNDYTMYIVAGVVGILLALVVGATLGVRAAKSSPSTSTQSK